MVNFGTIDMGDLYDQLGTANSIGVKAVITQVNHQGVIMYKGRAKNKASYNHIYYFAVVGKKFNGSYKDPMQQHNVGESIQIFYLKSDPRINRSSRYMLNKRDSH